jgi:hypothetical protein
MQYIFDVCLCQQHWSLNASNFKYLGVTITANFTWSEHIDRISAKGNQRLGLIGSIKHLPRFNARILFYNSLVLPTFDYGEKK